MWTASCKHVGAWCQVTVASTSGLNTSAASTALASFQSRELQPGEGEFAMQLDAVSCLMYSLPRLRSQCAADRASGHVRLHRSGRQCHGMHFVWAAVASCGVHVAGSTRGRNQQVHDMN